MTILYLAGPMTGLPELNYPAFHAAAVRLKELGHTVLNPADNKADSWLGYMRKSLIQIAQCDAIVLLPNWHLSYGATIEQNLALDLGLIVYPLEIIEEIPR